MHAKILKGSKDKKLLSYGLKIVRLWLLQALTLLPSLSQRLDDREDYLKIVYNGKPPEISSLKLMGN
jgi:hypothetical protein